MKAKRKQSGITLMEMTVVVAAVALLAVFGLPAIRAFINSLESKGPTEAMINAALSSARSTAIKERHYAGVRFQKAYNPKGPLEASQYMILIIHDFDKTKLAYGFRAVEGLQPIRLPDLVGVMDLRRNKIEVIDSDGEINTLEDVNDTTTFSIVFSPSGKLVIHDVRVSNRDGSTTSKDDIFNTFENITDSIEPHGMFVEDDGDEPSRSSFIIYDRDRFRAVNKDSRYEDYLENLASNKIYVNPYVGTIIEK